MRVQWVGNWQLCDQSTGVGREGFCTVTAAEFACFHDFCTHFLTNPVRYKFIFTRRWRWPSSFKFSVGLSTPTPSAAKPTLHSVFIKILLTGERNESFLFSVVLSPFFSTSSPGWLFKVPWSARQIAVGGGRGWRKALETKLRFFGLYSIARSKTPGTLPKTLALFLTKICNFF